MEKKDCKKLKEIAVFIENLFSKELNIGRVRFEKTFGVKYASLKYALKRMQECKIPDPKKMEEYIESIINGFNEMGFKYKEIASKLEDLLKEYRKIIRKEEK